MGLSNEKMIAVIALVLLIAVAPLVLYLIKEPEPLDLARIRTAFIENNLSIGNDRNITTPAYGAIAEQYFTLNGAPTRLLLFPDEATRDRGMIDLEVEAIRGIPAHLPKDIATVVNNGRFVLAVVSENRSLRERVTTLFKALKNPTQR